MINLYSINATTNAMRLLKQNNLALNVVEGSPVQLLNLATNTQSVFDNSITDEHFFQDLEKITALKQPAQGTDESIVMAETAAGVVPVQIEDHEPTLYDLKKMSVARCAALLDFSRNVIQPVVQQIVEANNATPVAEITEDWALVPVDADPALNHPVVQALINKVPNPTANGWQHDDYTDIRVPDVVDSPETGRKTYDDLVTQLLSDLNLTTSAALKKMLLKTMSVPASDTAPSHAKEQILFLLLSAYYLDNPWENSSVGIERWKAVLTKIFYTNVGWAYLYAEGIVTRVKNGLIVYNYDTANKRVYVCQEAFDAYLEVGGTVEALLGAIYLLDDGDTKASVSKQSLLDNQDAYTAAWERRSTVRKLNNETDWLSTNKNSLKIAFNQAIDTLDPAYLNDLDGDVATAYEVKQRVNQHIDKFFNRSTTDIVAFIIRCTCLEVFGEEDIASLMLAIHAGMVDGQQPDAVASDWIINYYLNWLLSGISINQG